MKVFNYFEFLFESDNSSKMRIFYSDQFRSLLKKISDNKSTDNETARVISEQLLSSEAKKDILDTYTLIDITDKNDKISYVQTNRILRDSGLKDISGLQPGPDYKFWREGRTPEFGIGRWVRRVFADVIKSPLTDPQIELFVNAYKSVYDSKDSVDLSVVQGEDIKTNYLEDNYVEIKGQLGNSCMRYERCQSYLDIYVQNPEVCKLLVLKEGGKVKGRALLWILSDGRKYIDRIYTIQDSDKNIFKDWAKKNGYDLTYDMTTSNEDIKVHLKVTSFSKYPYMDTFEYYDDQNGILYENLPEMDEDKEILKLKSTGGGYETISGSHEGQVRDIDGDWIDEDDARWCEDVGGYVWYENAIWMDYIGIYVSDRADTRYSEYHSDSFYPEDVVYNEETNDYYYPDWTVSYHIEPDEISYIPEEYTSYYFEYNDEKWSIKNFIIDPYTKKLHWRKEEIDGKNYEDFLDEKIMSELGLPNRLSTEELEKFRIDLVDEMIQNSELVKNEIKRVRDLYKRSNDRLDQSWYYYLAPIIYCIVWKDGKVVFRNGRNFKNGDKEIILSIVDKLDYPDDRKNVIKRWLENRFNEYYWRINIFTICSEIRPTLFGDSVYKKYLYLNN